MCAMRTLLPLAVLPPAIWCFRVKPKRKSAASTGTLSGGYGDVKELFTFGAPGTGWEPAWNEARTGPGGSDCFPGLRFYKEGWYGGIKYHDFAAGLPTGQWHAKMNVMVLGPEGSPSPVNWGDYTGYTGGSLYSACNSSNDGQPDWPNPWGALPSVVVHTRYGFNTRENTLDRWTSGWYSERGSRDRDQFIRAFAAGQISDRVVSMETFGMTDADITRLRASIETNINNYTWQPEHPGRFNVKLVGALQVTWTLGLEDKDNILLVQQQGDGAPGGLMDNDCILAFEGTDPNYVQEFWTSANFGNKAFCGSQRHSGFVDELWHIISDRRWNPAIRDKLGSCRSVRVAGFSLGGALAETFSFCAQRRQSASNTEEFQKLAWTTPSGDWRGERLGEITRGDGDGVGLVR